MKIFDLIFPSRPHYSRGVEIKEGGDMIKFGKFTVPAGDTSDIIVSDVGFPADFIECIAGEGADNSASFGIGTPTNQIAVNCLGLAATNDYIILSYSGGGELMLYLILEEITANGFILSCDTNTLQVPMDIFYKAYKSA